MTKTTISLELASTSPVSDIFVKVLLDELEIFSSSADNLPTKINHEFDDDDSSDHLFKIVMLGKGVDHTQIDDQGNILKDVLITVKNFEFDGINVDQIVWQLAQYQHDFNGSRDSVIDSFFGDMGCNGTVSLKFTSPVYLWLLENM